MLRQHYVAGEKLLVDYAGQTVPVVDRATGEVRHAQIFVAVLGASNYTYLEATGSQGLADWIGSHRRCFEFLGGAPALLIPDNLKAGVTSPCFYDPELNRTYQKLAEHYQVAVMPARIRRPRDKAKAETGVQGVERWILARLRHRRFFSLAELNEALRALLTEHNRRPFQKLEGCRESLFQSLDRPALSPLPAQPFEYAEWRKARVNIDYHVEVERHWYSVPHSLLRQQVEVRLTSTTVEILHKGTRVGLAVHKVAKSCKVSPSTVLEYERRAQAASLNWPLPEGMDDAELEQLLSGGAPAPTDRRGLPEVAYLLEEMRKPHVTLTLLWMEYKAVHPEGYQYTQFWRYYQEGKQHLEVALRQEHRAGEKLFSDYSGDSLRLTDPHTGEVKEVPVFVAVLGASNYTYAEAAPDMTLPHWIGAHIRALEYYAGSPQIIVPDNTRTAVIHPDRYEPDLNPAFADMAAHYGTVIIPARVRKPRDKAKVEAGVLVVERWIIAALRHRTFFSLAEMNAAIRELLERLNGRLCKGFNASRRELFERLDRPALQPLPAMRYEFLEWKSAKVGIDYHISVEKHCYSVPYQLVGQQVEVRLSAGTVEVLHRNRRVASHLRSSKIGGFTTCAEHMPKSHQRYLEWTPSRIVRWAERTGPQTAALVERILAAKPHPEMGYRSCLGLIRLGKQYSPERLEAACARALQINALSYRNVKSILQHGLDQAASPSSQLSLALPEHANLRGREYYQN